IGFVWIDLVVTPERAIKPDFPTRRISKSPDTRRAKKEPVTPDAQAAIPIACQVDQNFRIRRTYAGEQSNNARDTTQVSARVCDDLIEDTGAFDNIVCPDTSGTSGGYQSQFRFRKGIAQGMEYRQGNNGVTNGAGSKNQDPINSIVHRMSHQ